MPPPPPLTPDLQDLCRRSCLARSVCRYYRRRHRRSPRALSDCLHSVATLGNNVRMRAGRAQLGSSRTAPWALDGRQRRLRRDAVLHVRQPVLRLPDHPQRLDRVHVAVVRRKAQHASAVLGAHFLHFVTAVLSRIGIVQGLQLGSQCGLRHAVVPDAVRDTLRAHFGYTPRAVRPV